MENKEIIIVRLADPDDLDVTVNFYNTLIDDMDRTENLPRWKKDVYPSRADLEKAVRSGSLYLAEKDGDTAGAFVMNHIQNEAYHKAEWKYPASDEETAVLHLVASGTRYRGQGIGKMLLSVAAKTARNHGDKVIRLDTLTWNSGGQHLYENFGFHFAGDVIMDYLTTGPVTFHMYEYRL